MAIHCHQLMTKTLFYNLATLFATPPRGTIPKPSVKVAKSYRCSHTSPYTATSSLSQAFSMGCGSSNLAPAVAAQALESASRALQPEELSEAEAGINESFELDDNTFDIIEDPSLELRAEGEEGQLCRAAPVTDYTSLNPVDLVSATQNLGTEWRLKRANKGISKGSLKDDGNQVLRVSSHSCTSVTCARSRCPLQILTWQDEYTIHIVAWLNLQMGIAGTDIPYLH